MKLREACICALQRLRYTWKQVVTWLNGIGSLVALYALQNPVISDKLLGFIPAGHYRDIAAVALPVAWFWVVQKGKEIDRLRQQAPK